MRQLFLTVSHIQSLDLNILQIKQRHLYDSVPVCGNYNFKLLSDSDLIFKHCKFLKYQEQILEPFFTTA